VNEVATPFEMPAVSRHLKALEAAGLISGGRRSQWRPCRVQTETLREVHGWLARYRRSWTGSIDKISGCAAIAIEHRPKDSVRAPVQG
jgi:DNA-binding transcriptional ArsR family regulator